MGKTRIANVLCRADRTLFDTDFEIQNSVGDFTWLRGQRLQHQIRLSGHQVEGLADVLTQ